MSTLLLSLLLIFLVGLGLLMNKGSLERFESAKPMDKVGSDQMHWSLLASDKRADCKSLDKGNYTDLDGCKKLCDSDKNCNLINYDDDAGPSCFMQSCNNLKKVPYEADQFPGAQVWGWLSNAITPTNSSAKKPVDLSMLGPALASGVATMPSMPSMPMMPAQPMYASNYPMNAPGYPMPPPTQQTENESHCPKPNCPKPECPDMSQYVKLDEVPCWNCSLP